jgi:dTDP-glucose 4,6-dehydratase
VKRILITGAAGFIGSHMVEEVIQHTDWEIVALVRLGTIGDLDRITSSIHNQADPDRIKIVWHDLKSPIPEALAERIGHIDYVCHLAANSHVERSIRYPVEFFEDNVMGTVHLLEWARQRQGVDPIERFLNFNTDEVFGPAPDGYDFTEEDRYRPSNPYSGSKVGQAGAGYCYFVTYGLPVISTNMMNVFGERQNPEKLVPKSISHLLHGEPMPIHCKIENGEPVEIGLRHWLHARNAANATLFLIEKGTPGEFYNIAGDEELDNKQMVDMVGKLLGVTPEYEWVDFHKARPGHDRRYAISPAKLHALGWRAPLGFEDSLAKTVAWYVAQEPVYA